MGKGPGKSSLKPGFHTCMIAVITAIARKKGSAIVAIISKPLSSYRSNHSHRSDNDHWDVWDRESSFSAIMVITVIIGKPLSSNSNCSGSKKISMQCVRSPVSRWLPPWEPDQAEKKVKNTRTGYGRFLKKSVPSGSGREAVPVLNLKNGANDVVQPRSPQYFLSDHIATIIWKPSTATIAETIFSVIAVIMWKPSLIKSLTKSSKKWPWARKMWSLLAQRTRWNSSFFQVLISEQMLFVLYQGQ